MAGRSQNSAGTSSGKYDNTEYSMTNARRGRAVIFNHYEFDEQKDENGQRFTPGVRQGTHKDAESLSTTLGNLGFEVDLYDDLTFNQLKEMVKELSKDDHEDCDCVMVVVLTHGAAKDMLLARDKKYAFKEIWKLFKADKCGGLANKPKIFITQACKGEKDEKVHYYTPTSFLQMDSAPASTPPLKKESLPTNADFLFGFSSCEGYYSYRIVESGSLYIQSFCEELDKNADKYDLLKMLTTTSRRVASQPLHSEDNGLTHQMPLVKSTLRRDIFFR